MTPKNNSPETHRNGDAAIVVKDLHKSFGEQKVLDGVNLSVGQGETVGVLGQSGTGKSVLLKLVIGLQKPDSGCVKVLGQDIAKLDIESINALREKIGFLFQQAALYDSLTILENVMFPMERHSDLKPDERRQHAQELLKEVGIEEEHLAKLPSQISGGMQKRVGLARALALDPDLLLFDEPTAGLDPITAVEIDHLILELKKKREITSIMVTHDIHAAKTFSDRVAMLQEGKIVAEGTIEELEKSKDGFVSRFFNGRS